MRKTYSLKTLFQESFHSFADILCSEKNEKTSCRKQDLTNIIGVDIGGPFSYKKDYKRKGFFFHTQGFSFQEVKVLSQNLSNPYSLYYWVKENKKKPVIAVSGKEYSKIRQAIFPLIIKWVRYKLPGRVKREES